MVLEAFLIWNSVILTSFQCECWGYFDRAKMMSKLGTEYELGKNRQRDFHVV